MKPGVNEVRTKRSQNDVPHRQQERNTDSTSFFCITGRLSDVCKKHHPAVPCKKKIHNEDWFQMRGNRCVKAFKRPLTFDGAEVIKTNAHIRLQTVNVTSSCSDSHGEVSVTANSSYFCRFQRACGKYGGHLVSFHNRAEWVDVICTTYRLSSRRRSYWIGIKAKVSSECLH